MLIVFIALVRLMARRGLPRGVPRSPIEPGKPQAALPGGVPPTPAIRDGKATVDTLMEDFAEGRISVEEYERRLDQLYSRDKT